MLHKWIGLFLFAALPLMANECCCCWEEEPLTCCSCECPDGPSSTRLSVRHREGNGIGYPRGYTSFDLLYSQDWGGNWHTFADLRGHIANDGKWTTNAGLGVRYLNDCCSAVYGLNLFWDWLEARHMNFHQLGAGIEFLWPCWDLRFNGYAPVSRTHKTYRKTFDKFKGNQAYFERKEELALSGFDGAVGCWLYDGGCFGIHTALGGYYFRGDHKRNLGGGLFRAKVKITDYVTVEGQASYDSQFKWIGQGELALHLPFGPCVEREARSVSSCCDLLALEYRLVEQVERFAIPPTITRSKSTVGLDSETGLPLTFYFVDNTSSSAGTFESPFPTFAQAVAASG